MTRKNRLPKALGASALAAATLISGLSFGSAAIAAPADTEDTKAAKAVSLTNMPLVFEGRNGTFNYLPSSGGAVYPVSTSDYRTAIAEAFRATKQTDGTLRSGYSYYCLGHDRLQTSREYVRANQHCGTADTRWSLTADGKLRSDAGVYVSKDTIAPFAGSSLKAIATTTNVADAATIAPHLTSALTATVKSGSVNHAAKTATLEGTATKGATVSAKGKTTTANASTGRWELNIDGLAAGANNVLVEQKIGGTTVDSKTVPIAITATANGGFTGTGAGFPASIEAGTQKDVSFGLRTSADITSMTGTTATVTAPAGTTFPAGTTSLEAEYKLANDTTWSKRTASNLTGTVSADGTTFTGTMKDTPAGFHLDTGAELRWTGKLAAATTATPGTRTLGFDLKGTSNHAAFTTKGTSAITITAAPAANGGFTGTGAGFPASIEAGTQKDVSFGLRTSADITSMTGTTATVTAPAGTTFPAGTTSLEAEYKLAGDTTWSKRTASNLTGTVSADGTTFTGTMKDTPAGFHLDTGAELRWTGKLAAATTATPGTRTLGFDLKGTSNHAAFTTKGTSAITITAAPAANGGFTGTGAGFPASIEAGTQKDVSFGLRTSADITSIAGTTATVTAPAGTTFPAGTTSLEAEYKLAGDTTWSKRTASNLTGTVSADGTTFTGTMKDTAAGFHLDTGAELRWTGKLAAATTATPGTRTLGFDLKGTSNHAAFTTKGTSAITITQSALAPITNATRSVKPGVSNHFTGTGEPNATFRVLNVSDTQIVPGTLQIDKDGKWEFDRVVSNGAKNFRFVIEQTKGGKTEKSTIFDVTASQLTTVTNETRSVKPGVSNHFTGTGEPNATFRVLNVSNNQIVPGTLQIDKDGKWEFDRVVSNGAKNFRFVIEQTKAGQIEKSAVFDVAAIGLAPVTTATTAVNPGVSNHFTGTGEPNATFRVLNISDTQIVPGSFQIDKDGNWEFDRAVDYRAKNFRFVIEQTKGGMTEKSELFDIPANTK